MKKFLLLSLSIVLFVSLQSCCKKEEPKPTAKEIITKDAWNLKTVEAYDSSSGMLVYTNNPNTKVVFAASGDMFSFDTNGNISGNGIWNLMDDDNLIIFDNDSDNIWSIDELKDNLFIISQISNVSGDKRVMTFER